MLASVLVAYATRSGSTGEVAQAIRSTIHQTGLEVDLAPMRQVDSLVAKTAVILGTPLYVGRFPKEFHRFVHLHHVSLATMHLWVFVLGPTRNTPADFEASRKQAVKQLRCYPWLRTAELHICGGCWSPATLPFPFSLVHHLPGRLLDRVPAEDIRDWDEIHLWANKIAAELQPAAFVS